MGKSPVTEYEAREKVIEELADIQVCIYQLIYLMNCTDEVNKITLEKLERQLQRIEGDENDKSWVF